MKFEVLLAKSYAGREPPTEARLYPHLRAVAHAGLGLAETVGELVLQQLALPLEPWLSRLRRGLFVAGLAHDIGKANDGFQKMVRGQLSPAQQPARHELLSALLLATNTQVGDWALNLLSENGQHADAAELLPCVIAAVGGHHLKLDEAWHKASIALRAGGCGATEVQMLLTHRDLRALFGSFVSETLAYSLLDGGENYLGDERTPFAMSSTDWRDVLDAAPEWWRFAAALKALTTAADVAGSALLPKHIAPKKWIREMLNETRRVTATQMREVVTARLGNNAPRDFQNSVAQSQARITLVEAGCGTGKTAAAYMWAEKHAAGRKLFFCYPTTGTATEGFLGYVAETEVEAKLMHSRAAVDLEELQRVKGDQETDDHQLRIESLDAWSPQVVVSTADTVLALPRNNRRGLYNSPAILTASFVFDELHAYDNRMFAAVVALIKALPGAHFLLMTASLTPARRKFLERHIKDDLALTPTPRDLEELDRYLFDTLPDLAAAYQKAADAALNGQKKVLWICNTVGQAQRVYDCLKNQGLPVCTYHSRFKYEHRVKHHKRVVEGFDPEKLSGGLIAVTTQVAEMSLDLDADLLISEIAPVSALIQRLGRLNRRITVEKPGTPRTAYFIEPAQVLPYDENSIGQGRAWLTALRNHNRPLKQADLAKSFKNLPQGDKERLDTRTAWLDSGWFARPEPVRDAGVSVRVILPEDEAVCRDNSKELTKKEIPMNFSTARQMDTWREFKGRLIAPPNMIDYDPERGAQWK
jgi:CRISPR-associated endonuclease/helicase Cas3